MFRIDADFWRKDDFKLDSEALDQIRADEEFLVKVCRFDEGEAAFFARQTEFIKARSYDVKYPSYRATELIPVETDAGPGATTITFRSYDAVGVMKMLASYGTDLSRADVFGVETHVPVKAFGNSYGYNIDEIRQAIMAGIPLDQRKANAARLAYEQMINRFAWFADGSIDYGGIYGMFFNPYITKMPAPNGGWCDVNAQGLGKTPQQIIQDITVLINKPNLISKGIELVDTVILPRQHIAYLKNTMVSDLANVTIFKFVQDNNPGITFEALNEAFGVTPSPATPTESASVSNIAIAYTKSPDKLGLQITQPFEQFPVQVKGLEYEIPCHARHAGVIFYYPLSACLMYGL
jgi:hypothetical protein